MKVNNKIGLENLFYIPCKELTPFEEKLREFCFLYLNPFIKDCLANWNYEEFQKYGFNSCRQTAVFTLYIVKSLLEEDKTFIENNEILRFDALECHMKDSNFNEDYVHCINILEYRTIDNPDNVRAIIIDMSRTICPLLFYVQEFSDYSFVRPVEEYPIVPVYSNISIESCKNINDYIYDVEYFSRRRCIDILPIMKNIVLSNYVNSPEKSKSEAYEIYRNFAPLILRK